MRKASGLLHRLTFFGSLNSKLGCMFDFEVREFSQSTQIPLQNRNPPPFRHIDQILAELTRCPVDAFFVCYHPCAEQFVSHGIKRRSADLKLVQQPVPLIRPDRIS
ncbi:MAG: hypothetical protein BA870_08500 [Desulfuromonadales bacterium C00003094]|nr:MAG: hypothetical protein BA870_08500 [Desulfuromonadales bacterium C00003094]